MTRANRGRSGADDATAGLLAPALTWLRAHGDGGDSSPELVRRFLVTVLPAWTGPGDRDSHEVAWALGDLYERAGLGEQARLCRSSTIHETLTVRRWVSSFAQVPDVFWQPALSTLQHLPEVPRRVRLSVAAATAVLETVGDGLTGTVAGELPAASVLALDDRFRWTEEFPWMSPTGEADIPPLRFVREHLLGQRLLVRDGRVLRLSAAGRDGVRDPARLWRALVDPTPRWEHPFELDTLGVLAASLLRAGSFTPGRVAEELTSVLAAKWRPATDRIVFESASLVVQGWYQLGVPLGWWDTGRGPADRFPNAFGKAAAIAVFRAVGTRPVAGGGVRSPGPGPAR